MAETNLRRGLMLSDGNFMGFLGNPISATFLFLAATSVAWHLLSSLCGKKDGVGKLLRS